MLGGLLGAITGGLFGGIERAVGRGTDKVMGLPSPGSQLKQTMDTAYPGTTAWDRLGGGGGGGQVGAAASAQRDVAKTAARTQMEVARTQQQTQRDVAARQSRAQVIGSIAPSMPGKLKDAMDAVSYTHLTLPTICSV